MIPKNLGIGLIWSFFFFLKKSDSKNCYNYTGMTLLSILVKKSDKNKKDNRTNVDRNKRVVH